MSKTLSQTTIRSAFPLIPEEELFGQLSGLKLYLAVNYLIDYTSAEDIYHNVANWMLRHPLRTLASCLPGLWLVRDTTIQDPELPARVIAALSRLSFTVWADVLELTPSFLFDIHGFGEGCLEQFLVTTVRTSAEACCYATPPARCPVVNVFESINNTPKSTRKLAELRRLVDWAAVEAKAKNISEMILACSQPDVPEDIKYLYQSLNQLKLSDLFFNIMRNESLEKLIKDLCMVLDSRSRLIFLARISLNNSRTLENLANEMGITRERVRQIYIKAEKKIVIALQSSRFAPVTWRANSLGALLGSAVPRNTSHLNDALLIIMDGFSDDGRELVADILLWLSGPYTWNNETEWLCSREFPREKLVETCSNSSGHVDISLLKGRLSEHGLLPGIQSHWIEQFGKIKEIDGILLLWTGSVCDKAVRLLEIWNKPETPEAIINTIGEGHDPKVSRSRLFEDTRLMRVDMTRVGLRVWGMEEYSTIAEEIGQEIDRQGGRANLSNLVAALIERFGIRENSIRFYTTAPMFVLEGDILRRRTSIDPLPFCTPVTETTSCYLLDEDALSWRIEVTGDTLRGSGRLFPAPMANWLGVTPGEQRLMRANAKTVKISWPETSASGPTLGSIRFLTEKINALVGDQALLVLKRKEGTIDIKKLDTHSLDTVQGFEKLALLTGIPNEDGENAFLHRLGMALGVSGTRQSVRIGLRRRGEDELASLVPGDSISPELDLAIEGLKDLF